MTISESEIRQYKLLVKPRADVPYDTEIIATVPREYGALDVKGKTVMDLGGNIGAFSVLAYVMGAKEIISYEPDPGNFLALRGNTEYLSCVRAHPAAMTSGLPGEISLYRSEGPNQGTHTIFPTRGRTEILVKSRNITEELIKYQPEVVKSDTEGAEWEMFHEITNSTCVTEFIAEIHFKKKWMRKSFPRIAEIFSSWECIKRPKDTGKNWHTIGHWRRV